MHYTGLCTSVLSSQSMQLNGQSISLVIRRLQVVHVCNLHSSSQSMQLNGQSISLVIRRLQVVHICNLHSSSQFMQLNGQSISLVIRRVEVVHICNFASMYTRKNACSVTAFNSTDMFDIQKLYRLTFKNCIRFSNLAALTTFEFGEDLVTIETCGVLPRCLCGRPLTITKLCLKVWPVAATVETWRSMTSSF